MHRFTKSYTKLILPAALLLACILVSGPASALSPVIKDAHEIARLGIMLIGIIAVSALAGILALLLFALREIVKSAPRDASEAEA